MQDEARVPVLVRDDEQVAPGLVDAAVEIPVRLGDELAADTDRERVTSLVRREDEPVAEPVDREVLGRVVVWRHVLDLARVDAADEDVAVAALLADALDRDAHTVRRHRLDAAVAADLEASFLAAAQVTRHDVEVDAVATVRRVREHAASDAGRPVDEAGIDDERVEAAVVAEHVELRAFVATGVDLDEHAPVGQEETRDRLVEARQLLELAAARCNRIELVRPRDVRPHEEERAVTRERERHCLSHLEQRAQIGHLALTVTTP